jgi:XTP/dITP diphosphohydrolase
MQILLATGNPHKLNEVRAILHGEGINVLGLDALDIMPDEPVEDANSFEGNARLKAVGYALATGRRCLADDSGLCVDALDGAPGIYSARYAGTGDTRGERDEANNAKLLLALEHVPHDLRTARFVCCMCLANPDGSIVAQSRGTFEGVIVDKPRGANGFGYDPLLELAEGCTSADLDSDEKNRRSHRAEATRAMVALLRDQHSVD